MEREFEQKQKYVRIYTRLSARRITVSAGSFEPTASFFYNVSREVISYCILTVCIYIYDVWSSHIARVMINRVRLPILHVVS